MLGESLAASLDVDPTLSFPDSIRNRCLLHVRRRWENRSKRSRYDVCRGVLHALRLVCFCCCCVFVVVLLLLCFIVLEKVYLERLCVSLAVLVRFSLCSSCNVRWGGARFSSSLQALIAYRIRVMCAHVRLKWESRGVSTPAGFEQIFAVLAKGPAVATAQTAKAKRDKQLSNRPHPFPRYREVVDVEDGEEDDGEDDSQVVSRFWNGEAAIALHADGSTTRADIYEAKPSGFAWAKWYVDGSTLELEIPGERVGEDGQILAPKPAVKKKPSAKKKPAAALKRPAAALKRPAAADAEEEEPADEEDEDDEEEEPADEAEIDEDEAPATDKEAAEGDEDEGEGEEDGEGEADGEGEEDDEDEDGFVAGLRVVPGHGETQTLVVHGRSFKDKAQIMSVTCASLDGLGMTPRQMCEEVAQLLDTDFCIEPVKDQPEQLAILRENAINLRLEIAGTKVIEPAKKPSAAPARPTGMFARS